MVPLVVRTERLGPILGRHPWVFSRALKAIPEGLQSGQSVNLTDESGRFVAQGYFNSYSQIAVRLWGWGKEEEVNDGFFIKRITQALAIRQRFVASEKTDSYRLVNAENDFLPGLIVDRYGEYATVQFHTTGIKAWQDAICRALVAVIDPRGIYERSDVSVGGHKQQAAAVGVLWGEVPDRVCIRENGLSFWVDIKGGQKTGFFLDQRDKRSAVQKYVSNQRVLNCFSYTGGFTVYALAAGAAFVTSFDVSLPALALAEENVALNGFDQSRADFIAGDAKAYLAELLPGQFDMIILDPPAFVKDRKKIKEGIAGYRRINESAIRALPAFGTLVTASCSAHVSLTDFRYLVTEAASRAGRSLQILEQFTHGIDHPELSAFTEGEYLKCLFARVI